MNRSHYFSLGAFAVMFAAFLWAVDGIFLTPRLFHLGVPLAVFLMHAVAFVFMAIPFIIEWKEIKKLNYKDWIVFFLVALFGGAIGTMAITKALFYVNFINLSVVVLLQKLQPVFAILIAVILLKERPRARFYLWALVALIGSYLVTFGFTLPNFDVGDKVLLASLFSIIAAAAFGSSTSLSKYAIHKVSFRMGTYLRFGITTLVMLFVLGMFGSFKEFGNINGADWIVLLIIALTTGGIAIFIYYYGLKRIPASVSTICELMFPFSAIVLEYILRGNILSMGQWLGAVLLIFSVVYITRDKREVEETLK